MRFITLIPLKLKNAEGLIELKKGDTFEPTNLEKILPLIESGKVRPAEKAAYKIYSEILDAFLWICETGADKQKLQKEGITEPIYTGAEIAGLKKLPKDDNSAQVLNCIHRIKSTFEGSTKIENINLRGKK